jgi:serine/threonine-protein kinase RsbW
MTSVEVVPSEDGGSPGSAVELRVPAQVDQLAVVRAAVATVAAAFDLTVDEIADARLAVDEACTKLVRVSLPHAALECRITGGQRCLNLRCSTAVGDGDPFLGHGLSWYILKAVSNRLSAGTNPPGRDGGPRTAWIEFSIGSDAGPDDRAADTEPTDALE